MDWYEPELRALETTEAPPPGTTLFYGSSTIRMWTTLEDDFPHCLVSNRGFGGATLEACAHFFERLVPPPRPGSLVLYAGDNDLGDGAKPDAVVDSFLRLQDKVHRELGDALFTFISIKPSPARWIIRDRICKVNDRIRREPVNFLDIYPSMLGPDGRPAPKLFLADGLHMSPAGYEVWKRALLNAENTFSPDVHPVLFHPAEGGEKCAESTIDGSVHV